MATRLHYAGPIARQFLMSTTRRVRPGGLAALLPAPGERPFVIVTGSGRSGTSAVARVLHESGISMGTDFDPPGEANSAGFYEDRAMRSVNKLVYGDMGLSKVGAGTWPWRSTVLAAAERYTKPMRELIS